MNALPEAAEMAGWPRREAPKRSNGCCGSIGKSWLRRAEYCLHQGILVTTLDYYLHREALKVPPRLARVKLTAVRVEPAGGFALMLRTGRRIESAWNFREADLERLIRVAEAQ